MNLNTNVVYPDPTAYFDNKTNIPGQSYLVDKWMNRTEIKICMMFDFDDVDNLLREVVGDYKNDKKTKKNLNEEDQNDEEVLLL